MHTIFFVRLLSQRTHELIMEFHANSINSLGVIRRVTDIRNILQRNIGCKMNFLSRKLEFVFSFKHSHIFLRRHFFPDTCYKVCEVMCASRMIL